MGKSETQQSYHMIYLEYTQQEYKHTHGNLVTRNYMLIEIAII
jgi:hypothetical protein